MVEATQNSEPCFLCRELEGKNSSSSCHSTALLAQLGMCNLFSLSRISDGDKIFNQSQYFTIR